MVIAPPMSRSSLSTDPMANGFSLNETAGRQIHAERFMLWYFHNSLAATQPNSADKGASFSQHRAANHDCRRATPAFWERVSPAACCPPPVFAAARGSRLIQRAVKPRRLNLG